MLDRLHPGTTAANKKSDRFQRIKQTLLKSPVHLCLERAELITAFFRSYNNPSDPVIIQKAKALRYLLRHKSVRIFPHELIAGNVGYHRKSAILQPELSSVFGCQELLWIDKRQTTPFQMSWKKRIKLIFKSYPTGFCGTWFSVPFSRTSDVFSDMLSNS
ncbi:MAG: hypothetical protein JRE12_08970 [Deltaproteobacteria bacterium]|nr:hypothetical protein [Deltaproteobacteria bacterium]